LSKWAEKEKEPTMTTPKTRVVPLIKSTKPPRRSKRKRMEEQMRQRLTHSNRKVSGKFHVRCSKSGIEFIPLYRHHPLDFKINCSNVGPKATPKKEAPAPSKAKDTKNGESVSENLVLSIK
jgi:hypothetical protein